MTSTLPYFFSEPLKARFAQDIREALGTSRIDHAAALWLRRLVDADKAHLPAPRIERVSIGGALPQDAELAGAWIISDPLMPGSALYLNTSLLGIERFSNRATLVASLSHRFKQFSSTHSEIDEVLVEGAVFEQRMRVILEHQAWLLDSYSRQLHDMPTLEAAAGAALQDKLASLLPGVAVDVSQPVVQICSTIASPSLATLSSVMGTQTLADAAFQNCSGESLRHGLERRFMDAQGATLSAAVAASYVLALDGVTGALPNCYKRLLSDYWSESLDDDRSRQQLFAQAIAQAFRHQLLKSRASGSLSEFEFRRLGSLLFTAGAIATAHVTHCLRLTVETTAETEADTAGLFIMELHGAQLPGLYLFSASSGFTRIANRLQLNAHFAAPEARTSLLRHVALADQLRIPPAGAALRIRLHTMGTSPFEEQAELVSLLQARNLAHVLSLPAIGGQKTPVRVDDALDVRRLLDSRLVTLRGSWRWQTQTIDFHTFWNVPDNIASAAGLHTPDPMDTWAIRMQKLDALVDRLARLHPGGRLRMQRQLDRYLLLLELPEVDVATLQVMLNPAVAQAMPLWAVAFARLGNAPGTLLLRDAVVQQALPSGAAVPVAGLPVALLDWVITSAAAGFAAGQDSELRHFHSRPIRGNTTRLYPEHVLRWVREDALRLQLAVGLNLEEIEGATLAMLQQVLDRPDPALRQTLGNGKVDAYRVELRCPGILAPLRLPTAFVLKSQQFAQRLLVWLPGKGLRVFASLSALVDHLNSALAKAGFNTQIINLLAIADRLRLRDYLGRTDAPVVDVALQPINGHFLHVLQEDATERSMQNAALTSRHGREWQLLPEVFCNVLTASERDDDLRPMLNHVARAIEAIVDSSIIPPWLGKASVADQERMLSAIRRFVVSFAAAKSFLFGIPSIYDFCRQALQGSLDTDFPGAQLKPELIEVTLTHYVPMPVPSGEIPSGLPAATGLVRENLIQFAINRFASLQDGTITLSATDSRSLPAALDPLYVRKLVRALDVAAGYRVVVDKALQEGSADYAERRKLFEQQLPPLDGMRSFEHRLRNELSEQALNMIQAVLEMPDGIARLPIDGLAVEISPLLLYPGRNSAPDAVIGAYLIAPRAPQPGPWIIYTPWNERVIFKEYPDQAALVTGIQTSAELQQILLESLDPECRRIYDNGGFIEPHIPFSTGDGTDLPPPRPEAVTIRFQAITSNALATLFKGALDIFRLRTRLTSVTSAEEARASSHYLLGLGTEQLLAFAPGRLGALVGIWQSRELLSSTAIALGDQRWGKAFSEFMAALSVMISSRQAVEGDTVVGEDAPGEPADTEAVPDFSWSNQALTPQLRSRLRSLQAQDVTLSVLRKDDQYNTYIDEGTGQHYAAIGGAVYPVISTSLGWFVGTKPNEGPSIRLNAEQCWVFNFDQGLKGGGGLLTRIKFGYMQAEIEEHLVVQACGMGQIRHLYPSNAQCITSAHVQARVYLENCLANLNLHDHRGIADARVKKIVGDFFVEKDPDAQLYTTVRHAVSRLYEGLTDPSLSPDDSSRFVFGVNRLYADNKTTAFTIPDDPLKRVFLTEKFFRLPVYRFKARVMRAGSFDYSSHYMAAILIHELSHLTLATEDITYVDADAPFLDLLEDAPGYRLRVKNEQIAQQQRALSYNTDRSQLFRRLEGDTWRDLKRSDNQAKAAVLRITGKDTLEQARDVFYDDKEKRRQIMLGNADSVALLVTLLGRERFIPPAD